MSRVIKLALIFVFAGCSVLGGDVGDSGELSTTSGVWDPYDPCSGNLVGDPGFEEQAEVWVQSSLVFPDSICDETCSVDERVVPYSGERFAWLGGTQRGDSVVLSQLLDVPAGDVEMSFYLRIDSRGQRGQDDVFTVRLGDRTWFRATEADADDFTGYRRVRLVGQSFGGLQELEIRADISPLHLTSFFVDDLFVESCSASDGVPLTSGASPSDVDVSTDTGSSGTTGEESGGSSSGEATGGGSESSGRVGSGGDHPTTSTG